MSDDELQALREIARRVERHYGHAQDIEWAVTATTAASCCCKPPQTVWSTKEWPLPPSGRRPAVALMNIFGGRR
jgi:pyruvate,water dikinase